MKFICFGSLDQEKMDPLPKSEIESIMNKKKERTIKYPIIRQTKDRRV